MRRASWGKIAIELRRRNLIATSAMPYRNAFGITYDCGAFADNMETALEKTAYTDFAARRAASAERGKLRGIGIG